ncbi:MAG: helix-turn-helix transcriptional regulator [Anaerolineaceae bacterium]|nr:helix-turn-helix transcriptional regulator [Anaerolineaceae bacterium]
MNIGSAIKLLRTSKNLRLQDVALDMGISTSYLSLVEQSKRDPNIEFLKKVADVLEIPLSILIFIGNEDSKFKEISPDLYERISNFALGLIMDGEDD